MRGLRSLRSFRYPLPAEFRQLRKFRNGNRHLEELEPRAVRMQATERARCGDRTL